MNSLECRCCSRMRGIYNTPPPVVLCTTPPAHRTTHANYVCAGPGGGGGHSGVVPFGNIVFYYCDHPVDYVDTPPQRGTWLSSRRGTSSPPLEGCPQGGVVYSLLVIRDSLFVCVSLGRVAPCAYPRICSNCAVTCFHILGFIASKAWRSSK